MTRNLIYIDEADRSYGLSGMAVSLALLDNEDKIMEINLDRSPEAIDFVHEFYFTGNPRCSAKVVWDEMARNFHLSVAMSIGNLLSRRLVENNTASTTDEEEELRRLVVKEGAEWCGLDEDEVMVLWQKDLNYLKSVFTHPRIKSITGNLAVELLNRRVMSRHELLELLSSINRF